MKTPNIDFWHPGVQQKGGIQSYGAALLEVLKEYPCTVFLKNDVNPEAKTVSDRHYFGQFPKFVRTSIFIVRLLHSAWSRRPDLVLCGHLHFSPLAYFIKRLLGMPYWVIVYGVEAWEIESSRFRKALMHADKIISISATTQKRVEVYAQAEKQHSILPCPIDLKKFKSAPKSSKLIKQFGLDPSTPILLTVSRLIESDYYKGYEPIIAALPELCRQVPNLHYLIVGDGDARGALEQRIQDLGLSECVTFTGFVSDAELVDYYNLCDLFVMPSKREGFGIVFLEALACGKPVLAGNCDGARDALLGGELGVLIDPENEEQIITTIVAILEKRFQHPLIYDSEKLRSRVAEEFAQEVFAAKFREILAGAA